MMQVGRNLTDPFDGFLRGKRFLILDRDKKFTTGTGHSRRLAPLLPLGLRQTRTPSILLAIPHAQPLWTAPIRASPRPYREPLYVVCWPISVNTRSSFLRITGLHHYYTRRAA